MEIVDMNKRVTWSGAACAVGVLLAVVAGTARADTDPRLVFELPSSGLDFGKQKQGETLTREVVFRNEGGSDLHIQRVTSGSGAIKVRLDGEQTQFAPGAKGRLRVELDTSKRMGLLKKAITVFTNTPESPSVNFNVRVDISLGMRVEPVHIRFGPTPPGQPLEARLTLRTPKAESDWTVESVGSVRQRPGQPGSFTYTFSVEDVPDETDIVREVRIRHPAIPQPTAASDVIVIRTTYPGRPEIRVFALLRVMDPILFKPRRAVLGYVSSTPPPPPVRIHVLAAVRDLEFAITGHRFEAPKELGGTAWDVGFVAKPVQNDDGTWWIEVSYDGKKRAPGPIRAILVVETDYAKARELRIECWAVVKTQ